MPAFNAANARVGCHHANLAQLAQWVVNAAHAIAGAANRPRTGHRVAGEGLPALVIEATPRVARAGGDAGDFLQGEYGAEAGEDGAVLS